MRVFGIIAVVLCGGLFIYGTIDFPGWGDPKSPASTHLSPYYIEHSIEDTSVPNIVTAVLADYRGYDTMFETTVVFAAGIACIFLLMVVRRKTPRSRLYRHVSTGVTIRIERGGKLPEGTTEFERIDSVWVPYDLIIKNGCRLVVPFIQLFALYVVAHGHHSPGGGFQGGVIFGAAIILYALAYDLRTVRADFSIRTSVLMSSAGVLIYAGTGALCIILGANFLDYGALAGLLRVDPVAARSLGILIVEIGVALAVLAVMVSLYLIISSAGKLDEGL